MSPARRTPYRLDLLARGDSARFVTGVVVLAAGDECAYRRADWVDALVEVEIGELELEATTGTRVRFAAGTVLTLHRLRLRALRSVGAGPTVLVTITRSPR